MTAPAEPLPPATRLPASPSGRISALPQAVTTVNRVRFRAAPCATPGLFVWRSLARAGFRRGGIPPRQLRVGAPSELCHRAGDGLRCQSERPTPSPEPTAPGAVTGRAAVRHCRDPSPRRPPRRPGRPPGHGVNAVGRPAPRHEAGAWRSSPPADHVSSAGQR